MCWSPATHRHGSSARRCCWWPSSLDSPYGASTRRHADVSLGYPALESGDLGFLFLQPQLAVHEIHRHAIWRQELVANDATKLEAKQQAWRAQVEDDEREIAV